MLLRKLLAPLLCLMPVAAHADWSEANSAHFVVYSEQAPAQIKEFATKLERFDQGFRRLRGFPNDPVPKAQRVRVFVINRSEDVIRLARNDNVVGFYRPRRDGPVAIVPRYATSTDDNALGPMAVLLHEYAHHLMSTMSPNTAYPLWLTEGFAEFNATATFGGDGSVTFGAPPMYRAGGLSRQYLLPLQKLFAADTLKLTADERGGLYARGWLLTHYLAIGAPERKGQFTSYINAINGGTAPVKAAEIFGDLGKLHSELERYKTGRFSALVLRGDQLPVAPIEVRKLSADAAADRAIAADPKLIEPYILKALIHMTGARYGNDHTPATWAAIRQKVAAANRIDPDHPEPLAMFYTSYVEAGLKPTDIAIKAYEHAFLMAPWDTSLRMGNARVMLRLGDKDSARTLLAPLAFAPHQRGFADQATKLIAEIDAGKAAEALRELETGEATAASVSASAP